jgi:hypothetical protein
MLDTATLASQADDLGNHRYMPFSFRTSGVGAEDPIEVVNKMKRIR